MNFSFEKIDTYPNATILHHIDEQGNLWATSQRNVIKRNGKSWNTIAKFPFSFPRDVFAFSRPTARLMRSDKCNIYINKHGKMLGVRGGSVYAVDQDHMRFLFHIQGDCVLHRSIVEDEDGALYFGEYFMNPERKPVRIWQVDPQLETWRIVYEIMSVRHVHGIYEDPLHRGNFWVTVGDFEGECYLLKTCNYFKTLERYGDGSQIWRAVNLFFTQDHINWLTDSNLEQNHACRMHRTSHRLEIGQTIDASVWYGCTTIEDVHIAFTTIEQGPAIMSNTSTVLASRDAFNWEKVYGFKKDFWRPVKLFKYGVISCPSGPLSINNFYISGEGLVGLDGSSMQVKITIDV